VGLIFDSKNSLPGFDEPTDCMIVEQNLYVIEYHKFSKGNLYIFSFEDD
jgi:hypothetical protein